MSMEDYHCDTFALYFQFKPEELNRDALLEAVKGTPYDDEYQEYSDDSVDIALSFGSRDNPNRYHAHLRVRLREDNGRLDLSYHQSPLEVEEVEPPYLEDCAQWLGGFFKFDKVKARIHTSYIFDDSFSPIIALPFPLVTTEKALTGSLVTGLSLLLPKDENPEMVIVQSSGDNVWISHSMENEISLKDFDLSTELKRLSTSINPLIKKQVIRSEKDSTPKTNE